MLVARRVDFFVDDELAGLYLIQKNNQQGIELHPYIVNNDSVYFMLSETTLLAEDRAAINSAILNNQQAITEIIARYVKH
jgi:polar amino acid transport system substrate-binding protein